MSLIFETALNEEHEVVEREELRVVAYGSDGVAPDGFAVAQLAGVLELEAIAPHDVTATADDVETILSECRRCGSDEDESQHVVAQPTIVY